MDPTDISIHDRFLLKMQEAISVPLPGQLAQYLAVPPNRPMTDLEEAKKNPNARKAAVLALLHPIKDRTHLALIRRNEYPGVHSGQISFPGGKVEENDPDLEFTATRETQEEIGVEFDHYELWGKLTEVYIPPSGFLVQPYVGLASSPLNFTRDPREVVEVINAPLDFFLQPEVLKEKTLNVRGMQLDIPVFDFNGHIIWGATAMMISELITLIKRLDEN